MTRNYFVTVALVGIASCHSKPAADQTTAAKDTIKTTAATAFRPDLKSLHFDYSKDPACGMPLKAGLEDTTHYKGRLYGFCSKECKEAFLKEPATYIAQIK
jgi:YHS domain-containing protein